MCPLYHGAIARAGGSEHKNREPIKRGPDAILEFVSELWRRLTKEEAAAFCLFCQANPATLGSICSGADGYHLVFDAIAVCVARFSGTPWQWQAAFSCEKHPVKRRFLMRLHKERIPLLFVDARDVAVGREAFDDISGSMRQVPRCCWLIAGFPCTDVSALNPSAFTDATRTSVRDHSKRTGSVFGQTAQYLTNTQVPICILENVIALAASGKDGGSPLHDCVTALETAGYVVQPFYVDAARSFGYPIRRSRLYLVCVRLTAVGSSLPGGVVQELLCAAMDRMVSHASMKLEHFLNDETDPEVRAYLDKLEGDAVETERYVKRRRHLSWAQQHNDHFEALGLQWWKNSRILDASINTGLRALQLREIDLLNMVCGVASF